LQGVEKFLRIDENVEEERVRLDERAEQRKEGRKRAREREREREAASEVKN